MNGIKKIDQVDSVYLNLFRGVSAQLVLIGHLLSKYGYMNLYKIPKIQNLGVLVFFVLSGFLITQTALIKGKSYTLKNYLIDRFSRIYSAFLPALLFVLFIDCIMHFGNFTYNTKFDFSMASFFSNVFMLQSHPIFLQLNILPFGSARPFWTVSIEWFYYVFFGLLFFFSLKKSGSLINYAVYFLLFLFCGYVVWYYLDGRGGGLTYYWFFGFLLAISYNNSIYMKNIYCGTAIVISIVIISYFRYKILNSNFYDIGLAFLFALLLMSLMKSKNVFNLMAKTSPMTKVAALLASFSYSLYLIHFTLIDFFKQLFNFEYKFLEMIFLFIFINAVSYIFYLCFEKHHLKLRYRLKEMFA